MISTFQALFVALLALLPGASYTFAVERVIGGFGRRLADRLVRFFAASAAFAAVISGPAYALYRRDVVSGRLREGHVSALVLEASALTYVAVPLLVGTTVGWCSRRGLRPLEWIGGAEIEPRAWDYVWRRQSVTGVVRVRLKSGAWLAGVYGTTSTGVRSFAAGYPEAQDLFLSRRLTIDPENGAFLLDEAGNPVPPRSRAAYSCDGTRSSTSTSRRRRDNSSGSSQADEQGQRRRRRTAEGRRLRQSDHTDPVSSEAAERPRSGS